MQINVDANGDAFTTLADRAAGALAVEGLDPAAAQLITALVLGFAMDRRPETEKALRILSGVDEKTPADGAETAVEPSSTAPKGVDPDSLPVGTLFHADDAWGGDGSLQVFNFGGTSGLPENEDLEERAALVHIDIYGHNTIRLTAADREALALTLLSTL